MKSKIYFLILSFHWAVCVVWLRWNSDLKYGIYQILVSCLIQLLGQCLFIIDLEKSKFKWYVMKPYELLFNLYFCYSNYFINVFMNIYDFARNSDFLVQTLLFTMNTCVFLFQEFSMIWYESTLSLNRFKSNC
jgi:hypothetical protein